ncbi:MAG TPA: ACT domain-containing protein [Chloroflexota bacterium]|nr:ACT domain-containing protein [Chloroflexota bacterium]
MIPRGVAIEPQPVEPSENDRYANLLGGAPDSVFARYSATDRVRYANLLGQLRSPDDVLVEVTDRDEGWTVAVCLVEFVGALSMIVGLLTAYRLNIRSADILSCRAPDWTPVPATRRLRPSRRRGGSPYNPPTHRLVDVFDVRALDSQRFDAWQEFKADLARLIASDRRQEAQDEVIVRASEVFRGLGDRKPRLLPIAIDVTNEPGSSATRLSVRSADTPGFLFAFATALADFPINVERAAIRTEDGEARDIFWVTDVHRQRILDDRKIHEIRVATTLIKQFTFLLPRSPNPGQALRQFNALIAQMLSRPAWTSELANLESPVVLETLADVMGVSRFLWEDFLRMQHESLFPILLDPPALAGARSRAELIAELRAELSSLESAAELVEALNAFKDREMFRIDLRHLLGRSTFREFSRELTDLAEVAVEVAWELAGRELRPRFGHPTLDGGQVCPWSIVALGKFGGGELGFGSDLELIFVYAGEGKTDGPKVLLNSEYFGHAVQSFLTKLKARQEGIFEVDLRLRPFGSAGALASSLDGFARYYSPHGAAAQFERLALVRLRSIGGDSNLARRVIAARDAFVYSDRPLDLENIQHFRQRQAAELVPRGQLSAKHSAGGSVDVEYFVQSWQITVGSADPSVRVTNTTEALRRLRSGGYLLADVARDVEDTYDFLRRLIDGLRVVRGNAKDLTIPDERSPEYAYLARRLKIASPTELSVEITRRMEFARNLWKKAPPRSL